MGVSIAGMGDGVLNDGLLGGTICVGRAVIDDLPVDVERTAGVCSTKFRPN